MGLITDFARFLVGKDDPSVKKKPLPKKKESTHLTKSGTIYRILENGQIEIVKKSAAANIPNNFALSSGL